jgi:hypothetical protein
MHGFVNLFAAAALARVADLDEAGIASILAEEDPTAFRFEDEALSWREHRVPADGIRAARRTFAVSFGSCSFDEPREDLTALGLLP